MLKNLKSGLLVALGITWAGLSGCSSEDPIRPVGDSFDSKTGMTTVTNQEFDSEGGTLSAAGVSVSVPAGSFSSLEFIELTISTETSFVVVSGDNSGFSGPLELTFLLPEDGDSDDLYTILEYDPLPGVWNPLGGVQSGNSIAVLIDHPATFDLSLVAPQN